MAQNPQPDYKNEGILLPPVIPQIKDWPIAKLLKDNRPFVEEVKRDSLHELHLLMQREDQQIHDLVEQTLYKERLRISEDPWRVDPKDEGKFWREVRQELVRLEQLQIDPTSFQQRNEELMDRIVSRFTEEIAGRFKPNTYHFAKRFLPFVFSTLLNASAGKTIKSVIYHRIGLQEKVHMRGEIERMRELTKKGIVILVPTHISNVDSIIVGWGLHALGLPAFTYGAGLNLYNSPILAYFMNRIGTYKVDRRKKNPIYMTCLNSYARLAISHGCHSLFFPGGTRSRTGEIEKKLKLGLLGSAMEAQRREFLDDGNQRKLFVIPVVMSYHFVLEAASLIRQHLKYTGKEHYYLHDDEFGSYSKFLSFVWKSFGTKSDITLSFGKPMDMFGNFVDEEGVSYDLHGRPLDIKGYFMSQGKVTRDDQRDAAYTRQLGERIIERYHAENHVFSSHLVAYVAFKLLARKNPSLDLYGLLRLPEEERILELKPYLETVDRVLARLREMADNGKVFLSQHLNTNTMAIVEHGISNLGVYHDKRPLSLSKDNSTLLSQSMNLLYYYHNRLVGYQLEHVI
ncbi:MAG: 1-acyl-sn-glycerol-3-phosphate acyltransferase [Bacteroidota bacterium]